MITPGQFKSSLVDGFDVALRVARIGLVGSEDYCEHLAAEELALSSKLDGRRRLEHLAGRMAARIALHALLGTTSAVIVRAADGAPEILGLDDPPLLSISHGRKAAVAAVGHVGSLGIDVCDHADVMRVRRVAVRFLRPEETALAEKGGVGRWVSLWALKEAAAKALRKGLLEGGLRASHLAAIEPPRFLWPQLESTVVRGAGEAIAVVFRR